jgi:hypothetical protein
MVQTKEFQAMWRFKSLLIAAPVAAGLLFAPVAHADEHGRGGWHGGERGGWHDRGYDHRGHGGIGIGGALLGLGAAAVVGGVIASQAYPPPPVVYAAPPAYYPPPVYYAPPPGYYAPPPGYYARPY